MKKFIEKIIGFSLILLVLGVASGTVFSQFDNLDKNTSPNSNIFSLQTKTQFDSLDILFVGNSYCYSSIDPAKLDSVGISSYNLGIASSGVEFYDLIVNDYLNEVKSYPKKLFLLISPMTFSSRSDNYSAYPIHRYLVNPVSNLEIAWKYNRFGKFLDMNRESMKKGWNNLLSQNAATRAREISLEDKGFVRTEDVITEKQIDNTKHLYTRLASEKFATEKVDAIDKLTLSLESKGIEVIYFEIPTNQLESFFTPEYLTKYERVLAEFGKSHKFLSVDPALFKTKHYRNLDHMNKFGAAITTDKVIEFIRKNKLMGS